MYSQNNEEEIILNYFNGKIGTLLDIGANDGKTLSNSLALIEKGWAAVLIEPAPIAYSKLCELHKGNVLVNCVNIAISNTSAELDFYSSGTHLNQGDTDLVSTLSIPDKEKWQLTTEFKTTKVKSKTFMEFMSTSPVDKFEFITIDCEGMDWIILNQMDLLSLGVQCLCIEHNNDIKMANKYKDYCNPYNLKPIGLNNENIIFGL